MMKRTVIVFTPISNYLDDFLFISFLRKLFDALMNNFIAICDYVGCPISEEKTECATEKIVFLGMLLNGVTLTLSIPLEKLHKAQQLLRKILSSKKMTIKTVQQLTSLLNFSNRAIVPGRTFTRRMYDCLKIKDSRGNMLKNHHHINIPTGFIKDCRVWQTFLTLTEKDSCQGLIRPFVDVEAFQYAETLNFFSDASLNPELGMGAVFGDNWIVQKWNKSFILSEKPNIDYLELYALTAAVLMWSSRLKDMRLIIFCDNQAVIGMINKMTSHCSQCMKLIRLLALDGIINNRRILVRYVPSKSNILADALSRLKFGRFWAHAQRSMKNIRTQYTLSYGLLRKFGSKNKITRLTDINNDCKL